MKRILEDILIGTTSFTAGFCDSSGLDLSIYGRFLLQYLPPSIALFNYYNNNKRDKCPNYNIFELNKEEIPILIKDSTKILELGSLVLFPYLIGHSLGNLINK
ncbi:MAG: hypothetical protein KC589_10690 [Nanoarchaeota archaeon]|nr:hypothetical protein [Nanoarchaeota archaeon]